VTDAAPASPATFGRRRRGMLAALFTGAAMTIIDANIVTVTLPAVAREVHMRPGSEQFVVSAYAAVFGGLLILGGRLGDAVGRKHVFLLAVIGFTLASLACGVAGSGSSLIAARVAQAVFAAMMYPQVLALTVQHIPPVGHSKAIGIYGAIIGGGGVAGLVLGGLVSTVHLGGSDWRGGFYVNVPLGLAVLVVGYRTIPRLGRAGPGWTTLDWPGAGLAVGGFTTVIAALSTGIVLGSSLAPLVALSAGLGALIAFVLRQLRRERHAMPVVIPIAALHRHSVFRFAALYGACYFCVIAFFVLTSLHVQRTPSGSAGLATASLVPFSVSAALASAGSARLLRRFGHSVTTTAAALATASLVGLLLNTLAAESVWVTSVCGAGFGAGFGIIAVALINDILSRAPQSFAGSVSGFLTTVQQCGGALGVSLTGGVYVVTESLGPRGTSTAAIPIAILTGVMLATAIAIAFTNDYARRTASQRIPEES
jgi:MFS family permease